MLEPGRGAGNLEEEERSPRCAGLTLEVGRALAARWWGMEHGTRTCGLRSWVGRRRGRLRGRGRKTRVTGLAGRAVRRGAMGDDGGVPPYDDGMEGLEEAMAAKSGVVIATGAETLFSSSCREEPDEPCQRFWRADSTMGGGNDGEELRVTV